MVTVTPSFPVTLVGSPTVTVIASEPASTDAEVSFAFTVIFAALSPSSTTTLVFSPSTKFTLPWVLIRDVSLPLF